MAAAAAAAALVGQISPMVLVDGAALVVPNKPMQPQLFATRTQHSAGQYYSSVAWFLFVRMLCVRYSAGGAANFFLLNRMAFGLLCNAVLW